MLSPTLPQCGSRFGAKPRVWLDAQTEKTGSALGKATIIVVDDDENGRVVTARMLRDEGYNVLEAHSAHQALYQLEQVKDIRLVLTDIAMPWMSGLDLAEVVSRDHPHVSIVLMSGYASLITKLGPADLRFPLLMKPFTAGQLASQVEAVLKLPNN